MTIKASYRGGAGGWMGVVKIDGRQVWECGHWHKNRDRSTFTSGFSACACAGTMVALLTDATYLSRMRQWAATTRYDPRPTLSLIEAFEPTANSLRASMEQQS